MITAIIMKLSSGIIHVKEPKTKKQKEKRKEEYKSII